MKSLLVFLITVLVSAERCFGGSEKRASSDLGGFRFPKYPPIADADPSVREERELRVPSEIPLPGKRYIAEIEIALFETDIPSQHMWAPKSGKYKVLWRKRLAKTVR